MPEREARLRPVRGATDFTANVDKRLRRLIDKISRAPPKTEEEKTGGTNRAAIAASTVSTGDPAASLGPTFRRADRRQRPS